MVIEKPVPVYISPDSALLTALLECDSNNQVILASFNELKSNGMESSLSVDSGRLDYKVRTVPDTVFVPGKDSIIYEPYPVPGEPVVKPLTWWQQTCIYAGYAFFALVLLRLSPTLWNSIGKLFKLYLNGK